MWLGWVYMPILGAIIEVEGSTFNKLAMVNWQHQEQAVGYEYWVKPSLRIAIHSGVVAIEFRGKRWVMVVVLEVCILLLQ